ncbi:MAG: PAS domain-containing protein, partial [Acidobacteriota bacterium]
MQLALTVPPTLISADASIEACTGFAPEEWLAKRVSLEDRVHPEDREVLAGILSPGTAEPCGCAQLRLRHADGRMRTVQAKFAKRDGADGVTVLDLELEDGDAAADAALEAIAQQLGALMDQTDDFMYVKDRDHRYVRMTPALVEVLGKGEAEGKTAHEMYARPLADVLYRRDAEVLSGGLATHEVQRLELEDGTHRWIDNRKYPLR